jgi:hypothetical protein
MICSKPTDRIVPSRRISSRMITGRMLGSVTCQKRRHGPAPSIAAASYCCSSTLDRAARKMIVPQPDSFQITCATSSALNSPGLPTIDTVCMPASCSRPLSMPVLPSTCWHSATTTTQDRKYGR